MNIVKGLILVAILFLLSMVCFLGAIVLHKKQLEMLKGYVVESKQFVLDQTTYRCFDYEDFSKKDKE